MRRLCAAALAAGSVIAVPAITLDASRAVAETWSPYVDAKGVITLPKNFRTWPFLGTFIVSEDGKPNQLHNVYTQPSTIKGFRETGKFPDGAVLVKEVVSLKSGDMTTGEVSWASNTILWFIMVKDRKGRYKGNPLWGNGWGWAKYLAKAPTKLTTKNYKAQCLGCHIPAKKDDWVYIRGYPVLRK